jgi:hypothetical protein
MAERGGFEPPVRLPVRRISNPVLSTTQPSLLMRAIRSIVIDATDVALELFNRLDIVSGCAQRAPTISGRYPRMQRTIHEMSGCDLCRSVGLSVESRAAVVVRHRLLWHGLRRPRTELQVRWRGAPSIGTSYCKWGCEHLRCGLLAGKSLRPEVTGCRYEDGGETSCGIEYWGM